jgi:DNA repair ATPase RecN
MRTVIKHVSATSGFLQNAPTNFAPGLNCIIGARGTCKSTLIESIRFAFDSEAERVQQLVAETRAAGEASAGMVRQTLGPGSIRCEVIYSGENGDEMVALEREVGNTPRIFVDGVVNMSSIGFFVILRFTHKVIFIESRMIPTTAFGSS